MGESFSETTHTGFGKRIINSLSGFIIGPILFLASFGLLYWNEGRVDLSIIATDATIITAAVDSAASASSDSTGANGKLVSVTDKLSAQTPFDDNSLVDARYAALKRQSEIYQWKETRSSETTNNTGGSSDTTTTYSYDLVWTSTRIDSKNFKQPEGHQNPDVPSGPVNLVPTHVVAPDLMIGSLKITGGDSMTLPTLEPLQLTAANTKLSPNESLQEGKYIYGPVVNSTAGYGQPMVGDYRISYTVLPLGTTATVFGKLNGQAIESYINEDNVKLFRLFTSTHDEAISQMHGEFTTTTWILRVVGLVMMWLGMMLFFNPLITIFNVLPIMGKLSGFVLGFASAVIAIVLTAITIVVSMFLHSILAIIVALIAAVVVIGLYFQRLKAKEGKPKTA